MKSVVLRTSVSLCVSVAVIVYSLTQSFSKGQEPVNKPSPAQNRVATNKNPTRTIAAYGSLPQRFEANRGQTDASVKFISRGPGFTVFLTETEAVLRLLNESNGDSQASSSDRRSATLRMKLVDASTKSQITGIDEQPGRSSYFTGNDSRQWISGVPAWSKVRYESVWPGIDLIWHGNQRQIEHDFVIAAGADPARIKLEFDGARRIGIDREGAVAISTETGELRLLKPVAWQEVDGQRRLVNCNFQLRRSGAHTQVAFRLGQYDRSQPLVIDPVLAYSTFLGGTFPETGLGIAVGQDGSAYITGSTLSADFPGPSAIQPLPGEPFEAFVLKLNPAGSAIVYATWIGGNSSDIANAIAVDALGNAYITGETFSTDFPRTASAVQQAFAGGVDAFVTKLNAAGTALIYSTYVGGTNSERALGIAVDTTGNAYITGQTDSSNFPVVASTSSRSGSAVFKTNASSNDWAARASGLMAASIIGLAIDPANANNLYALSTSGLYKSTDGGGQWSFVSATPLVNGVAPLIFGFALDPKMPDIIYLATSAGVYKSTNGGQNFELRITGLQNRFVNTLAVDPATPATLYAGTSQGVYKSVNGADSWSPVNSGLSTGTSGGQIPSVRRLVIDPINPGTIYAATNRGAFKTINGGGNWSTINNGFSTIPGSGPDIATLALDPATPTTLFAGVSNALYKSADGGASWQLSNTGLRIAVNGSDLPLTATALAVSPVNSAVVYFGSGFGVWKSTDGGANWSLSSNGLTSTTVNTFAADTQGNVYAGVNSGTDAFAARLNAAGSALDYSMYLGGTQADTGYGIAVDGANNAWVTGTTASDNFPVSNAFQPASAGFSDVFVTKINPAGANLFSTYLGGAGTDEGRSIAIDAAGNASLTGFTQSTNFPLAGALNAVKSEFNDAFVTRMKADGSGLIYSTYLGGGGNDQALGIAVDGGGGVWITGATTSTNFPVVNPFQPAISSSANEVFIAHLNAAGSKLLFSTYLGGPSAEQGNGIAVDSVGNAYVVGTTNSSAFPVLNPLQPYRGVDAFVLKLAASADLAVTINESRDPVMINNNLVYTLTVANNGPDNAAAVTLTDTLPAGINFVSASASQGSCSGTATVTCNLGEVEASANATVTITVTPAATGTLTNRATVSSTTPDLTLDNNSAMEQTRVSAQPSIAGLVTLASNAGLSGVAVSLTGGQTAMTTTNGRGFYQFADLTVGGNYNVTPARQGFVFNPPSRAFTNVTQDQTANFAAVACQFTITPVNRAFPIGGGSATITITSPDPQCPWTAQSNVPWITFSSAASGNGNGMVTFKVAATTASRTGTLTVAGRTFIIWQEANPCAVPDFITAKSIIAGTAPLALVSADFNKDGKLDLAVTNDDSKMTVLLGAAQGGFRQPISFNSASRFTALTTGDFNGDGNPDLAATFFGRSNNVVVHLGTGTGTFGAQRIFSADALPSALAVADFNGDNKQDLAVANEDTNNVSILFGAGDGSFGQAVNVGGFPRPFRPLSITAGDFTGDGKPDVAVTSSNSLEIIPGNGQGGFGALINLAAGIDPRFITADDLNSDGRLDLVVGNTFEGRSNILILLANASGGFNAPANVTLTQLPSGAIPRLAVGDLNADGKKDLVATISSTTSIIPLLGDGTGKFTPTASYTSGLTPNAAVIGEFTGDGKADVIAVVPGRTNGNGLLSLFPGNGTGGLIAARNYATPLQPLQLINADFTGDGKTDLLILGGTCQITSCANNGSVLLRAGDGSGNFNAASEFEVGNNPAAMVTGDFNNDGKPDVATANAGSNNVSIRLNNGTGGFSPAVSIAVSEQPRAIVTGDFNNDGKSDLAVTHVTPTVNQIITILLGNSAGGFSNPMTINSSQPFFSILAADLDSDGNADLVASTYSPFFGGPSPQRGIYVLRGNGGGAFSAARQISTAIASEMILFDFNGDGRFDIAAATADDKLVLLFGDGAGNFAEPVVYPLQSVGSQNAGPRAISLADFNGDGRPDIALTNGGTESVEVLLGNGSGNFGTPVAYLAGLQPVSVTAGDFNGDGRVDLATANISNTTSVLLNNCLANSNNAATTVSAASFTSALASEAIVAVFGASLATSTQIATTLPLPTSLGGTTIKVRDAAGAERFAPLFFVSANQINYQIPPGTSAGTAIITITSGDGTVSAGTASIETVAPGLFSANADGQGVAAAILLRAKADGTLIYESVSRFDTTLNRFVAMPIDFGPDLGTASDRLFLVLFGTGWRNRSSLGAVTTRISGIMLTTLYAGPQGDFVGLDQINVELPRALAGRGETDAVLTVEDKSANTVKISFR